MSQTTDVLEDLRVRRNHVPQNTDVLEDVSPPKMAKTHRNTTNVVQVQSTPQQSILYILYTIKQPGKLAFWPKKGQKWTHGN
jgi:hypothetical protein